MFIEVPAYRMSNVSPTAFIYLLNITTTGAIQF